MTRAHILENLYFDTADGSLDGNGTYLKDVLIRSPQLPLALFIAIVVVLLFVFLAICSMEDPHDNYAEMNNEEVHDGYEQEIEMECLDV